MLRAKRSVVILVSLLTVVAAGLPARAAPAVTVFTLSLAGPPTFYPGRQLSSSFTGTLSLAGVGVANQTIEVALDGVLKATAATATSGRFAVALPPINDTADHVVTATAFGGTTVEASTSVALLVERFTLSVGISGTGAGQVSSSPALISCSADCATRVPATTVLTLTGSAAAGSIFDGWSGDCTGTACVVTMTADRSVSGIFDTPAQLVITPAGQNFGTVLVGLQSGSVTFQVKNVGGALSGTPSVTLTGADATQFSITSNACATPLTPGASCNVTARFAPTSSGNKGGGLTATASPGGSFVASLTGTAVLPAQLTVSPTAWFPSASYNTSVSQIFTVTNVGGLATGIVTANLTGDLSAFVKTVDACGVILQPSQTCRVTVRYTQTFLFGGGHSANLAVVASPGGSLNVQLSGN